MNQEKKRLNRFLEIVDKHILKEMNKEKNIDTRVIGGLFNIRTEILTRLGEITSMERRKRMWKEFRESDYFGDHH